MTQGVSAELRGPGASAPRCCSGPCPHTPSRIENALNEAWCKPRECERGDCDNFCERAWEAALNAR